MNEPLELTCRVELKPGEKLTLPPALVERVGAGQWLITVTPYRGTCVHEPACRHDAFLTGYAPGDEGLYDDLSG